MQRLQLGLGFALMAIVSIAITGCAKIQDALSDAPPGPSGRIVAIALFKCSCDDTVRETVQNSFVDTFFKSTNAKLVKGESGDIVIVGTITTQEGSTAAGRRSGSASAGNYASGITVQAYKNGELIATHSVGQDLGRGRFLSTVALANQAARYLSDALVRGGEIGRR
jgi:hypothetical protein